MRLVRLEGPLRPTLDLSLRLRGAESVSIGQPKPDQRHRPSLAPRTAKIWSRHRVEFRPAGGASHAQNLPHGFGVSAARGFSLARVHDGLQTKRGGHADRNAACVGQGHHPLYGGPTRSGPESEAKGSIAAAKARGSEEKRDDRERQCTPPQPTHQQHTRGQVRFEPEWGRMRCKPEVEPFGSAQDQHRQPGEEVAKQDADGHPKNDAQQRHVTSTPKPAKGPFEEVHATCDVLATDGVRKAQVAFTARPKGRAR